jgi:hypothetical protein
VVASSPQTRFILVFVLMFIGFLQLNAQLDSTRKMPFISATADSNTADYQSFRYRPPFITTLPETIRETSGLLFWDGKLWTHNDSGNLPEIYQVDSMNGNVLGTVVVRNSLNTDWESITQDDSSIYIGDFGNNTGNRTDLHILKIAKTDMLNLAKDTVNATYIRFSYPDQTHFTSALNSNNFDCEAFFCQNDSLHLFSKNWADGQTKHYVLPATAGVYKARFVESFNADGLITDAAINAKGHIVLLGYKNTVRRSYTCFAWLLSGYEGSAFFGGNKTRLELGSALHLGQSEGIVLKDDDTGWISSESIHSGWFSEPAKLFGFNFGRYFIIGVGKER